MSAGEKGSGLQSLRRRSSSATTSISPVGMFLLIVFGVAQLHVADDGDARTPSARSSALSCTLGAGVGGETTCVMPLRSRRSRKIKFAEIAAAVDPAHEHDF